MEIFKIQINFKNNGINNNFLLKLPFCNKERELDTYWFYELISDLPIKAIYPILINWIQEWKAALEKLNEKQDNIFLSIGLWDECVEGFFVSFQENKNIKIMYGAIIENYGGYNANSVSYNINESTFHKEYETLSSVSDFKKNIDENIKYLKNRHCLESGLLDI